MKSKRRQVLQAARQGARVLRKTRPGRKSNYARKWEFLHRNGGFGFEYDDKPWK
jgi:hypothetical protein